MLRNSTKAGVKSLINSSYKKSGVVGSMGMVRNSSSVQVDNKRPEADEVLKKIASYVHNTGITSPEASLRDCKAMFS